MLGLEAVLAIVSLTIQVISAVDKAIQLFSKIENAPEELRLLRRSVVRLLKNFKRLEAALNRNGHAIPYEDGRDFTQDVKATLFMCLGVLGQYESRQSNVLRAFWPSAQGTRIADCQKRLDLLYRDYGPSMIAIL